MGKKVKEQGTDMHRVDDSLIGIDEIKEETPTLNIAMYLQRFRVENIEKNNR